MKRQQIIITAVLVAAVKYKLTSIFNAAYADLPSLFSAAAEQTTVIIGRGQARSWDILILGAIRNCRDGDLEGGVRFSLFIMEEMMGNYKTGRRFRYTVN